MSEFKISVVLLAALIMFELDNNPNVERVKMSAGTDAGVVNDFNIYAFVDNDNYIAEIELEIKDSQIQVIIGTKKTIELSSISNEAYRLKKPASGFDDDWIRVEAGKTHPVASRHTTEKVMIPILHKRDINAWRSMAKDVVGMALKEYNSSK